MLLGVSNVAMSMPQARWHVEVDLNSGGKDAVTQGLARAIADGKVDGSVTARRVHGGAVDVVGSAGKGETVVFESDCFSTYALGSAASKGAAKLPQTSDIMQPIVPLAVAGAVALTGAPYNTSSYSSKSMVPVSSYQIWKVPTSEKPAAR